MNDEIKLKIALALNRIAMTVSNDDLAKIKNDLKLIEDCLMENIP